MSSFLNNDNKLLLTNKRTNYYNNKKYNNGNQNFPTDIETHLINEYNINLSKIEELKSKLINYDSKINEITELNIKINHLTKLIKSKNDIINTFEQLSNISKEKFIYLIKKNNCINDNNSNELFNDNAKLLKILSQLKDQNNFYKKQINFQSKNNLSKINNIRNELFDIKYNINKKLDKSEILDKENNDYEYDYIINKLKNKINISNNSLIELEKIKNKYNIIEKQFNEKNNK